MTDPASPAPDSHELDPMTRRGASNDVRPYNEVSFRQMGILDAWQAYEHELSWGKRRTLAILDDGCTLSEPAWQVKLPWGPKVITTWNALDGNTDCSHVAPGYHGTTVGLPSSVNLDGLRGVAYNNHVAHVRCVSVVHLRDDQTRNIAAGLQWVIDNARRYNITTVNLAPVDDQRHQVPQASVIDRPLSQLRQMGIWVSAPSGNHHDTQGISWPACQTDCFAIGGVVPGESKIHLDRYANIDFVAPASATSSSNAYAAGCAQILHEAIGLRDYPWRQLADNMAQAIAVIFHRTARVIDDPETGLSFDQIHLKAALDHVMR